MQTMMHPPPPSWKNLNFRFDLVMERWDDQSPSHSHQKKNLISDLAWSWKDDWVTPPPLPKILNFRFGLVIPHLVTWASVNDYIFFGGLLHERPFTREGNSLSYHPVVPSHKEMDMMMLLLGKYIPYTPTTKGHTEVYKWCTDPTICEKGWELKDCFFFPKDNTYSLKNANKYG